MNAAATEPTTNAAEAPTEQHATPGRVLSTLAYELLSREHVSVWVNTSRNYASNAVDIPTDPGEDLGWSAHLRPVGEYHPFADTGGSWSGVASYLDDRVVADPRDGRYHNPRDQRALAVLGSYDEYFIRVEGPEGQNICDWGEHQTCSTVHRSNYRSLLRDYPDTFVTVTERRYDGGALFIPVMVPATGGDPFNTYRPFPEGTPFAGPHYDRDRARALADVLIGLARDYPVYDEEDMSALESDLQDEFVADDWFRRELLDDVSAEVASIVFRRLLGADYIRRVVYGTSPGIDAQCDAMERFKEAYREMLDASETIADPHLPASPGCHTVTSLFLTLANDVYGPEFESADTSGVVFRNRDDTITRMARFLTGNEA